MLVFFILHELTQVSGLDEHHSLAILANAIEISCFRLHFSTVLQLLSSFIIFLRIAALSFGT